MELKKTHAHTCHCIIHTREAVLHFMTTMLLILMMVVVAMVMMVVGGGGVVDHVGGIGAGDSSSSLCEHSFKFKGSLD